jgi:seryl-tRNA synthetase
LLGGVVRLIVVLIRRETKEMTDDSMQRKERYSQLIEDSAVVWHKLYAEEKRKYEELQQRYNALTKQIRKQGKDKVDDHDAFLRNYNRN